MSKISDFNSLLTDKKDGELSNLKLINTNKAY